MRLDPRLPLRRDQSVEARHPLDVDFRDDGLQDSALEHDLHRARRLSHSEQLQKLVCDPLARQGHEVVGALRAGIDRLGVGLTQAVAGVEAEETQDAQMILGNPLERVADEPHVALLEVLEPSEIIENLARSGVRGQGIDGEVPPCRVRPPIVGESDRRPAAIGRDIGSQGRDLERMAVADRGDRAMLDPGRNGLDARLFQATDHVIGLEPGCEIDVVDRQAKEAIANRAADIAGQPLLRAERGEQPRHPADSAPFRSLEPHFHASLRDRLTIIAAVAPQILRPSHSIS